ncbi:unnamed protein product [Ranitomeya imitator]|uniref:Peptidase C2 calpain domain-containing protein n=1 Tax=Ranitomeya imitator TaxID=111125 RepID=A0ABN9M527_9NEOB|nr:unnamed protein product [Ranitomeya imitator]
MGKDFFKKYKDVARTDNYKNLREVSKRFQLPIGKYVIVPATFYPAQEADFCLRIFMERDAKALEIGNVVVANVIEVKISSSPGYLTQGEKKHFINTRTYTLHTKPDKENSGPSPKKKHYSHLA